MKTKRKTHADYCAEFPQVSLVHLLPALIAALEDEVLKEKAREHRARETRRAYRVAWYARRGKEWSSEYRATRKSADPLLTKRESEKKSAWRRNKLATDPTWAAAYRKKESAGLRRRMMVPENRAKVRQRKLRKTPSSRVAAALRARLLKKIRQAGAQKAGRTWALVGVPAHVLRAHLEKQFLPGMTWENYGYRGWHIDHIRPCASFDLTDPDQQRACFHYTNLQPLWAEDNLRKSATWEAAA